MKFLYTVAVKEHGIRLLAFLREKCKEADSVKAIKRAIDLGKCSVNGKIERFSTRPLKKGEKVSLDLTEEKRVRLAPTILYEDEDLLICDKPPGFLSENAEFKKAFPKVKGRLELVHRLDKDTSGVIVLSKNAKMREAMEQLFADRKVHKFYLAVVDGMVEEKEGKIDNFLAKKSVYEGQTIWGKAKAGRKAVTLWTCLKKGKNASLLLCEPLTGRTHQLRVHLSEMGHAILGDVQYAKSFACPIRPNRQLLHAWKIRFLHPIKQKEIEVVAPIPSDFQDFLKLVNLN